MSAPAELLPCPFCGDPPVVRRWMQEYPAEGEFPAGEYEAHVTVCCGRCGIEMGEEYRSDVVAAWNTRSGRSSHSPSGECGDGDAA